MNYCDLSADEIARRQAIVEHTRRMVMEHMKIETQDETSLTTSYRDYFLQISFSALHPLMVFCMAKALAKPSKSRQRQVTNDLNLHSILGSHAINDEVGCYAYRATHWLDTELNPMRFFEILDRCIDEANRGYWEIAS